jgi:hypothetical protein
MWQPFRKATITFIVDVVLNVYICRGHIWYARYHICEDPRLVAWRDMLRPTDLRPLTQPGQACVFGKERGETVAWHGRSAITAESVPYPGLCSKEDSSITVNVMFLGQIDQTIDY